MHWNGLLVLMLAAAALGRGFYEWTYVASTARNPAFVRARALLFALLGLFCVIDAVYFVLVGHAVWPFG